MTFVKVITKEIYQYSVNVNIIKYERTVNFINKIIYTTIKKTWHTYFPVLLKECFVTFIGFHHQ